MVRVLASLLLFVFVAGCQTGTDTDGALNSAAVNSSETATEDIAAVDGVDETTDGPAEERDATPEPAKEIAKVEPDGKTSASSGDRIVKSVAQLAQLRKSKGERAAVEAVFACYKKARSPKAPLQYAQGCAAQDFALSRDIIARRPANASGTGDRALLVSKRHAARIGALLQFKGMGQAEFNTFGKYLHAVAEPAYKKALKS